jgi:hypothetical protein
VKKSRSGKTVRKSGGRLQDRLKRKEREERSRESIFLEDYHSRRPGGGGRNLDDNEPNEGF